jgi:hypothetical protein
MRPGTACLAVAFVALAGCSSILGIEDLAGPADAAVGDGKPLTDDAVTGHVTVQGHVSINGPGQPALVTTVELVRPDATVAATTTSDLNGAFVLTVATAGSPVDVAVHAKGDPETGLPDEYMYFAAPLAADRDVTLTLLTQSDLQNLGLLFGIPFGPTTSFLNVVVEDAHASPVAGATVTTDQPNAIVRYVNTNGQPDPTANVTSVAGLAFVFSQMPGSMSLAAGGAITAGPRLIRLVGGAVFFIELRP